MPLQLLDRARDRRRTCGRLMRSFSQSKLSSPPASTQRVGAVLVEQLERVVDARRLEQLERRHHVANHGHNRAPHQLYSIPSIRIA